MTWRFLSNKVSGKATIHVLGNSANIIVVGNSTVSNLTANSVEVLTGASIRKVSWGTDSGAIQVFRGANLVLTLVGTGELELPGLLMNLDTSANLNITGTANATTILEINKEFSAMSNIGGY